MTFEYIRDVIQNRWPKGEDILKPDRMWWDRYLFLLKEKKYSDKKKWEWLTQGMNENLLDILNYLRMTKSMQEYIIRERPDLIDKIESLDSDLHIKYRQELNMSKIEL